MGKLGLSNTFMSTVKELEEAETRIIYADNTTTKAEKQEKIKQLEERLRRHKAHFKRNLDDSFPGNIRKHLHQDIKSTKRGL